MQKQTAKYTAKRGSSIIRGANAVMATEAPPGNLPAPDILPTKCPFAPASPLFSPPSLSPSPPQPKRLSRSRPRKRQSSAISTTTSRRRTTSSRSWSTSTPAPTTFRACATLPKSWRRSSPLSAFTSTGIPMDSIQRAGDLVATHPCPQPGQCGKRMLLIGHMDTVFEKTSPFQKYSVKGTYRHRSRHQRHEGRPHGHALSPSKPSRRRTRSSTPRSPSSSAATKRIMASRSASPAAT